MNVFRKEVSIDSIKNKEEVIALLHNNIEPFHKDDSIIPFEGRISQDGVFIIRLSREFTGYNRSSEVLNINGYVSKNERSGAQIKITFTIATKILYLICFIFTVMPVVIFMSYVSIIDLKMPWYLLLFGVVFFVLAFTVTFYNDRAKALKLLNRIFM